ncbi:hypothetical protein [Paenibacillus sp. PL2-23]|uniref:hypothetical protein n=1 Tax=Paenibacillus sp. PL2-23 TaxID=2100729 RepID=UPI0030FBD6C3
MNLNEEHIKSLLAFVGYGDFSKADVVFLANEGGLGDRSVEENIFDICGLIREDSNNWLENDWSNGYWKINQWSPGRVGKVPRSPFLKLTSRMMLALEDQSQSCENWFRRKDINVITKVNKFLMEGGLYSNRPGISTALLDWRPLPRKTEREPLPYENVDQIRYFEAFRFKDRSDNPYIKWREERINLFRSLFKVFSIPVVLCVGASEDKKILAKEIWGISKYDEIELYSSGKKIYVSKEAVGAGTKVIISPFFGYEHMGYAGVCDLTAYIQENILIHKS